MYGWNGCILNVDLTKKKVAPQSYDLDFARKFLGGRGFAAKILWDTLPAGTDPLSPNNKLIYAAGPLTGYPLPNSGKLVVASKSPLTGGYGDGNIGTFAAVHMRKAGYDALIVEGKAADPIILHVRDKAVDFLDATGFWGIDSFETETRLRRAYGRTAGIVSIGPAGENLVRFACVVSQEGRAGGRPGIGAVMGSKKLKAVMFEGSGDLAAAYQQDLNEFGSAGYKEILFKPSYRFWKRQGTLSTVEWSNEQNVLPTHKDRKSVV